MRAARAQFGAYGYQDTKTTRIAAAAGLTLGALYHHFPAKSALFMTVLDEIEAELVGAISQVMAETAVEDPVDGFCNALALWVASYGDPAIRQVLLVDRAIVLGPGYEEGHRGIRFVVDALDESVRRGFVPPRSTLPLAHLIVSAVEGAGRYVGGAADADLAGQEVTAELHRFVRSLVTVPAEP